MAVLTFVENQENFESSEKVQGLCLHREKVLVALISIRCCT